ncbi:uncharacterized protein LOC135208503 [Macrobrachium nipponense]|uniref:uncharacterized protein LOC135208503 n=1 Tax=Macrobrachium nipponense TaxID=159736 RepID=UPI0030C7D21A
MMIIFTMTGASGLRVLDCRTSLWLSHRTIPIPPSVSAQRQSCTTQKRYYNIYSPHSKPENTLTGQYTLNRSCKNLDIVRNMSTRRDPPDNTEEPMAPQSTRENGGGGKRRNGNGLNNMINLMREGSSGLQAFGKHFSEKSSSLITRITPEVHASPTTGQDTKKKEKPEDWNDILNRWYVKYQDFIGITDLKRAQDRVTELSEGLLGTQSRRRNLQAELEELQEQLNVNHQRITKAELYSEEHYRLFDQARDMNARLKEVRTEFENCERVERDTFTQLSAAIRDCHERERTQAEQSKYWSIIASIVSAALASVITSVNNWVRIREIKDHVSANNQSLLEGYQKMHEDIVLAVNAGMTNTVAAVAENNMSPGKIEAAGRVEEKHILKNPVEPTVFSPSSQVKLCEEDVILLGRTFGESVKEVMPGLLANERKAIEEKILPQFDAIFGQLNHLLQLMSSAKSADVKGSLAEEMAKFEVPTPLPDDETSAKEALKTVVVEYSYKHIASAMAVGAGIGTLATAFLLGSFSGGSV